MNKTQVDQNSLHRSIERDLDVIIEKKISRGRNLSVSVQPTGKVVVRVPVGVPKNYVDNFVLSKLDWIKATIEKFKEKNSSLPKLLYETGDTISLFGETFKLVYVDSKFDTKLDSQQGILQISVPKKTDRKKTTKRILESYLKFFIQKKIQNYTKILNVKVKKVRIKTMKSLWGSCSFDNCLSFNLALVHCKPEIIEYLIVHEVCHTLEKNHSRNFWKLVKDLYPNFKNAELWLKNEGTKYIFLYQ